MEKLRFDFSDLQPSGEQFDQMELSVLMHERGFSILVFDEKYKIRAIKSWVISPELKDFHGRRLEMTNIISSESVLSNKYLRSTCTISNQWVALVPEKMIDEKDLPKYFKLLMKNPADRFLFFSEKVPGTELRLVWAAEKDMIFFCQNNFPTALLRHGATGLIDGWRQLSSPKTSEVYVNLQGNMLQVGVFEHGELLLFNTFFYQNAADFLYFVLLAYDQFRLSPENTPLFLSGDLMPNSEIWRTLYRFIADIRFLPRHARFVFPKDALELPGHLNFDLLAI